MNDYYVDGHFVAADSEDDAVEICADLYGYEPDIVRPWTDADQAELDRQADLHVTVTTRSTRPLIFRPAQVLAIAAIFATLGIILGVFLANHDTPFRADQPDTTIAPCSAYITTSHPHFDGPVVAGACVTSDGVLHTAP